MNFNLSTFIKNKRSELNITVRELAAKVGVSPATISKWEKGQIKHIKEDKVKALAVALDVSPMLLFGYNDIRDLRNHNEIRSKRIPVYNSLQIDFFNPANITKYITTDITDADFALVVNEDLESIKVNDVILFKQYKEYEAEKLDNKAVVIIYDNQSPILAIHRWIEGTSYVNVGMKIIRPPEHGKIGGVAVEIRRLI